MTAKDRLTVRSSGERSFTTAYYGVGQDQWRPTAYNPSTFKIGYRRAISPTISPDLSDPSFGGVHANLTDFGQIRSIDNIQNPALVGFPNS